MSNEQALLNCTFGWGKTCHLYYDSLEVAGKSYNLKDLTSIQPSYRNVLGVPSARLELSFGLDHLTLRGIADLDIARLMVSHLQPYCSTMPHAAYPRSRSSRARTLAREQARTWERTNKLPAILSSSEGIPRSSRPSDSLKCAEIAKSASGFDEEPPTDEPISLAAVPKAPVEDTSLTPGETLEAFVQLASNLSTYASPLPTAFWQPPHTPRFQPPLHSVHLIPPNQKFDSSSIPVPAVKSSVLPIIHVPVHLQHGECAHYSIGSTLCSDRITSSTHATYPPLDNGLLILTNRRVLYVGKRCKFTLAYTHLWYVSLLHTAIALHIEGQFRRIIIELEHPQEWASRIELLSFIARRSRPEPPTLSVAAVPGLNMTAKRQAIKPPSVKKRILADNATVPLLAERIESKIVEAKTIELDTTATLAYTEHETLDLPPTSTAAEPLELEKGNTPKIADQPTRTDLTIREVSQQPQLEHAPTQEFPCQPDLATAATQEFSPPAHQPDLTTAATQEFSPPAHQPDLATAATQEFSLPARQPDLTTAATQEFSLPAQRLADAPTQTIPGQSDVTKMATREFSLPPEPEDQAGMAQGLQLAQAEIARLQTAQALEQQPEITTSALYDPAFPLATLARDKRLYGEGEPLTQQLGDDDDRTIHLHERKLCQLRTLSLRESIPGRWRKPASDKPRKPISGKPREPVSDKLREPVSDKLREPVSDKLREPVSDKLREPVSDKLPDSSEITNRRIPRVRAPQRPS